MKKMPVFAIILGIVAVGVLLYGYARDGFWLGAVAVFLIWWADNDRKRVRSSAAEAARILENAPELAGKDFVQSAAYILEEIDKFKHRSPNKQQRFADALAAQQADWKRRGEVMPPWAMLKLLREIEAEPS